MIQLLNLYVTLEYRIIRDVGGLGGWKLFQKLIIGGGRVGIMGEGAKKIFTSVSKTEVSFTSIS